MKKSTDAEISKRVLEVYTLLTQGKTYTDIVRYCKQAYNITSRRSVSKYIDHAMKRIKEENTKDINDIRIIANAKYIDLYKRLYSEGKYKDCAYIQSRIDRINGLEEKTIKIVSHVNGDKSMIEELLNGDNQEAE
jgi:hypothetical protein